MDKETETAGQIQSTGRWTKGQSDTVIQQERETDRKKEKKKKRKKAIQFVTKSTVYPVHNKPCSTDAQCAANKLCRFLTWNH